MNASKWKAWSMALAIGATFVGLPAGAQAQTNWVAPDTHLFFNGKLFANGQSNNFGPAVRHTIDEYWEPGACTYDPDGHPAFTCDSLRFGLDLYPDIDRQATNGCTSGDDVLVPRVAPQEDGGDPVGREVQGMQNEAGTIYCNQRNATETPDGFWPYDPLDDALGALRKRSYPEAYDSDPSTPTNDDLSRWWSRPQLNLTFIEGLPQTDNGVWDDRVWNSLNEACVSLAGGAPAGSHPPIPTWVLVAPKHSVDSEIYGGLLAAAGGSGVCCYDSDGDCDIYAGDSDEDEDSDSVTYNYTDEVIDVCTHIQSRTEAQLRTGITQGHYSCSGAEQLALTGALLTNKLPAMECHLTGDSNDCNSQGSPDEPARLWELFSCIQMRPRDIAPEDLVVKVCPDGQLDCDYLKPEDGSIEWVDPNKNLYILNGVDENGQPYCRGVAERTTTTTATACQEVAGTACTVEGNVGRCAPGVWACVDGEDVCQQLYNPMPEICNGLDDDCDGDDDNLSTSWDSFPSYDPTNLGSYDDDGIDRTAIHCQERDVCGCSGGSFDHAGANYSEYVYGWTPGICQCGEGVTAGEGGYSVAPSTEPPARQGEPAACTAAPAERPVDLAWLALPLLGAGLWWRRRR